MYDEDEDIEEVTVTGMFRFLRRFSVIGNFTLPVAFIFAAASPLLGGSWWIALTIVEVLIGAAWLGSVMLTRCLSIGIAANDCE